MEILTGQIEERAKNALGNGRARELAESVGAGRLNPYTAARMLLDDPSAIGTLLSKTVVD